MELPLDFLDLLKKDYGSLADDIANHLLEDSDVTSIRFNLLKNNELKNQDVVPWCTHGRYLPERPLFTLDPKFHSGNYYVQEASSMLLSHVLDSLPLINEPKILDLCAAPGGKSTLILDYLKGNGLLVANEVIKTRVNILEENIIKWGYDNAVVTNNDPLDFNRLNSFFDVVVVDAPCSGEGMFRKDKNAINQWSVENVDLCSSRQKRIIADIISAIKPNGYLIYSTCTFNYKENIDNVKSFCETHNLKSIKIEINDKWGVLQISKDNHHGLQCLPGITKGEGFFIAIMQKETLDNSIHNIKAKKNRLSPLTKNDKAILEAWLNDIDNIKKNDHENIYTYNECLCENIEVLIENLNVKYSGILCGKIQNDKFIPEHSLAMSKKFNVDLPMIELSKEDALCYLSKNQIQIDSNYKSWCLVKYEEAILGWVKNLENRVNNYYPIEWRIRKL